MRTHRTALAAVALLANAAFPALAPSPADAQALPQPTALTITQIPNTTSVNSAATTVKYEIRCNRPATALIAARLFIGTHTVAGMPKAEQLTSVGGVPLLTNDRCEVTPTTTTPNVVRSPATPSSQTLTLTAPASTNTLTFRFVQRNQAPTITDVPSTLSINPEAGFFAAFNVLDPETGTATIDLRIELLDSDVDGAGPDTEIPVAERWQKIGRFTLDGFCTVEASGTCTAPITLQGGYDRTYLSGRNMRTDYAGTFSIRITANDRGSTGVGGPLEVSQTLTVTSSLLPRDVVYAQTVVHPRRCSWASSSRSARHRSSTSRAEAACMRFGSTGPRRTMEPSRLALTSSRLTPRFLSLVLRRASRSRRTRPSAGHEFHSISSPRGPSVSPLDIE